MIKSTFFIFVPWKIVIYLFVFLSSLIIPLNLGYLSEKEFGEGLPYPVWVFGNFDGIHYMQIARSGYFPLKNAFFPLYPMLIDFLNSVLSFPFVIAGQVISNVSFLLSLLLIHKVLSLDRKLSLIPLFFLIIVTYPTSFFYAAVYNDSLFLLFTMLTIYFARKKQWVWASVGGALSTFTRFNGLVLFLFVIIEFILSERDLKHQWNLKKVFSDAKKRFSIKTLIREKAYSFLLIPLALFIYLAFTQIKFADWYLVFSSLSIWNQDNIVFPLQTMWRYAKIALLFQFSSIVYWVAILELFFSLFYLALAILTFKKIRISYWIFFVVSILVPALTGTFAGMPRYGLHLYPFFLGLGLFLYKKPLPLQIAYFLVSAAMLFFYTGFFTRGYFVA